MTPWMQVHSEIASPDLSAGAIGKRISQIAGSDLLEDFGAVERFVHDLLPDAEISMKWVPLLGAWNVLVDVPGTGLAATHAHGCAATALLRSSVEVLALRERDKASG